MFSIKADGLCIYNDRYPTEQYQMISPVLKMADSVAGSLDGILPPVNIGYDKLKRMKSVMTVERNGHEIWEGRIVEDSYDFYKHRHIYCEGALAYLNDTCQPQHEYKNVTLSEFVEAVLDVHNSKVDEQRRIYFNYQNVDGGIIEYRVTQFEKTLETLNKVCSDYSCHMKLEKLQVNIGTEENPEYAWRKYLKFFKGALGVSNQTIEFGKNLLDYAQNYNMSELATAILPLGAVKTRSGSTGIGDSIDLGAVRPYDDDLGYGVMMEKTEFMTIGTEDQASQQTIVEIPGGYGYYVAKLRIKASTTDNPRKVYITARNHGGFGLYVWKTGDDNSYYSGKYSAVPLGFTDMIEEAVEVPYYDSEQGQQTSTYVLYVASFGGDIQLRVNMQADVSDELDEYYTVEDAMVSTTALSSYEYDESFPEDVAFETGKLYVSGEANPGAQYDDDPPTTKFLRTIDFIQNEISQTGGFDPGTYSLKYSTAQDKGTQVRILWYYMTNQFVGNTDWMAPPARFTLPNAGNNARYRLKFMIKYSSGADITPTDITSFDIVSGEKYGSMYVTAQSKNLFNDIMEQGSIIDSGDLIGMSYTGTDMSQIRSSKPLGVTQMGGGITGFDPGYYLLSGDVVQHSRDRSNVIEARVFFYDPDTDEYLSDTQFIDWSPLPLRFEVPNRGEGLTTKIRISMRQAYDSVIGITSINDIMLEQGSITPSMYEPPNTSLEEYGWIEAVVNWDDVENPDDLYYKAKTYLASGQFDHMSLDIKALDLMLLGNDVDALEINDYIRVRSVPHGMDRFFEITELDIPLDDPENMTFTLGTETEQTLTSISNNVNDDLLAKINAQTSSSALLDAAKRNAERAILDGFTNGSMVTVTDDNDSPTGLAFFRVWTDSSKTDTVAYNGSIPSARWNDIVRNPDLNQSDSACLYINTNGIIFYGNGPSQSPTITMANSMGQITADAIVAGTMLAERIVGGTLNLGLTPGTIVQPDPNDPSGKMYVHTGTNWGFNQDDNDHMVEVSKFTGIVQQGIHSDNWLRQIKILNGRVEGSVYNFSDHNWHTGGYLYMGDVYATNPLSYGTRLETNGPLILHGNNIHLDGSIEVGPFGGSSQGQTQTITVATSGGSDVTLRFTNGILTSVT